MGADAGLILGVLAFIFAVIGAATHFSFVSYTLDNSSFSAKNLLETSLKNRPDKCPSKLDNIKLFDCDNLR
jgi:hypothetical protein